MDTTAVPKPAIVAVDRGDSDRSAHVSVGLQARRFLLRIIKSMDAGRLAFQLINCLLGGAQIETDNGDCRGRRDKPRWISGLGCGRADECGATIGHGRTALGRDFCQRRASLLLAQQFCTAPRRTRHLHALAARSINAAPSGSTGSANRPPAAQPTTGGGNATTNPSATAGLSTGAILSPTGPGQGVGSLLGGTVSPRGIGSATGGTYGRQSR
jgi:hypothetical protein